MITHHFGVLLDTKKNNMCGIAGILSTNVELRNIHIKNMTKKLIHRGPDHSKIWENDILSLGHTRLSIIDLSSNGNQPMSSFTDRYVIVFNGEIYNALEIKKKIQSDQNVDIKWRGHSDTEVLINSLEIYGVENTLDTVRGMFAFALWDKKKEILILARDRVGEKPLYFGKDSKQFFFASELKAIKEIKTFEFILNNQSVQEMLAKGYVSSPKTIYNDIHKLEPGSIAIINNLNNIKIKNWWSLNNLKSYDNNLKVKPKNINEYENELKKLLELSVKEQMTSDVPYGSMLSGGIDSSLITAIMQNNSLKKIKTYTIGFEENDFNEAKYAKKISNYLNTDHTEFYFESKDALKIIPNLSYIYDEPFADSSQIPTTLISNIISKKVKVCLSGDGGDELFGGYNRYIWAKKFFSIFRFIPLNFRMPLSRILLKIGVSNINLFYKIINLLFLNIFQIKNSTMKIIKIISILQSIDEKDLYNKLITQLEDNVTNYSKPYENTNILNNNFWENNNMQYEQKIMNLDMQTYLPDDILVKVDRAAMSSSLETRIPFLDKRIIQFAMELPLDTKIKDNKGKVILRNILNNLIPSKLFDRPKQGFGIPLGSWLRNELKEWSADMIYSDSIIYREIIDRKKVEKLWLDHQAGYNNQYSLWNIIIFSSWLKTWH